MVYNLTSVKRVISKVFQDLDLKEGDHRLSDMIEWAGEALEKIGGFPTFETRVCGKDDLPLLVVSNYQTKLPCDFHSMIQVAYTSTGYSPYYPMRYGTGSFDSASTANDTNVLANISTNEDIVMLCMTLYDLTYEDALESINTDPLRRAKLNALLVSHSTNTNSGPSEESTTGDYTYIIKGGYLKTNIENGFIMLAYQAIPTDKEGYPMLPDNASFIEAVYWYITMKLLYPQWSSGQVRDAVYADAKRSWNFYCKQAYGNSMMPNGAEQLESIKNTWHRFVEEWSEHDSFFSTMGQKQIIYNSNR
jgi:hypothetical protein